MAEEKVFILRESVKESRGNLGAQGICSSRSERSYAVHCVNYTRREYSNLFRFNVLDRSEEEFIYSAFSRYIIVWDYREPEISREIYIIKFERGKKVYFMCSVWRRRKSEVDGNTIVIRI